MSAPPSSASLAELTPRPRVRPSSALCGTSGERRVAGDHDTDELPVGGRSARGEKTHFRDRADRGKCGKARRRGNQCQDAQADPRPARRLVPDALGVGTLWTSFVVAPTYWHDHPLVCRLGVTPRGDATPSENSRRLP